MRGMPTFQPYAPWLITMGRSAFFGSRAVHMVSASMSKVSSTGKPCGVRGMTGLLEGHGPRARAFALQLRGQCEHAAVGVPGSDDLQPDGESVRGPPTGQRDRRMAREVERPQIRIPGAADRAGGLPADRDRLEGIVVDGERGPRDGRRQQEIEALEQRVDATVDRGALAERVRPGYGRSCPRTPPCGGRPARPVLPGRRSGTPTRKPRRPLPRSRPPRRDLPG